MDFCAGVRSPLTLELMLTITPLRRSRMAGITAFVIAMVPITLVSMSSRALSMSAPSSTFSMPTPALLTSASSGPASVSAAAMLWACVTSSGRTRRRSERGSLSVDGVRIVATTSQFSSRKRPRMAWPKPRNSL